MGKSIREVERFDAVELAKWAAWYRINPFGDEVFQLAALRRQVGAYLGGSKDIYDYLPPGTYKPPPREQSAEEMYAVYVGAFKGAK